MNFLKRIFGRWSGPSVDRNTGAPIVLRVVDILGRYPGERGGVDVDMLKLFLTDALSRAERDHSHVVLDLDHTRGYSSSFLHKVFAGFGGDEFYEKACCGDAPLLRFKARDSSLAVEICGYLNEKPRPFQKPHFTR